MKVFTLTFKKSFWFLLLFAILIVASATSSFADTKRWRGGTSDDWSTDSNWSPKGAPEAGDDVIIGDIAVSSSRQPKINIWGDVTIKSLTIGDNGHAASLFVSANSITINGYVVVGTNGSLENNGTIAYYKGGFTVKDGATYKESAYSENNGRGAGSKVWPISEFMGPAISDMVTAPNTILFEPTTSGLGQVRISGKIKLASSLNIIQTHAYHTSGNGNGNNNNTNIRATEKPRLIINTSASLDPDIYQVKFQNSSDANLRPELTVAEAGILYVKAPTFVENYALDNGSVMFPTTLNTLGVIDYASAAAQTILPSRQYGVLRVSGGTISTVKTLASPIGGVQTTIASNLYVDAGVLDLVDRSLNRTATGGGTMNVANGAMLRLNGNSNFPANFSTVDLGSSSTVEYYGAAQTVANVAKGYGNLHLTGSGTKTMPNIAPTALVIAGNLKGSGSASFAALSNVEVGGNVDLSGTASFQGGSFTHTIGGDWINDADFTANTSKVIILGKGNNRKIKRTSTTALSTTLKNEFYNLEVAGLGTTIEIPSGQELRIKGNLSTTGPGTLTQDANGLTMTGGTIGIPTTISGSGIALHHLTVNGYTTTSASFLVNGNFTTNANGSFIANGGTITMGTPKPSEAAVKYNITHTGTGNTQFYNLSIARTIDEATIETGSSFYISGNLSGNNLYATAGNITFNGNSTFGGLHQLNDVTIAGGSILRMASSSKMSIRGAFTSIAATFTATSPNTVVYNGAAQNVNSVTYYDLQLAGSNTKTAAGNVKTLGNLTVGAGITFDARAYTHTLEGNWIHDGTYTGTSSNLVFAGTADASISGSSAQAEITVASVTVNKTASSVVTTGFNITTNTLDLDNGSISTINVGIDPFGTSAIKVKLLGERSGNGWVQGTIVREITGAGFIETAITDNSQDGRINIDNNHGYSFNAPHVKVIFPKNADNTPNITEDINEIAITTVPQIVQGVTSGVPINRLFRVNVKDGKYKKAILQIQYYDSELNGNTEPTDEAGLKLAPSSTGNGSWDSGLKNDWDIVANRVARKDILDLNKFWTLSDESNLYIWKGGTSNAWETLTNWKMVGPTGAVTENPSALPSNSDIVELGSYNPLNDPLIDPLNVPVINQPHIKSSVVIKGLQFKSVTPMALSIDSTSATASNLLVRGNVAVLGTGTAKHEIRAANRELTINGSLISENDGQVIHIKKSSGMMTVKGAINQNNANIYIGSSNLYVGGDYIKTTSGTGKFTTTGTVTYNGGAAQTVADLPYYNLTINKAGGAAQYSTTGNKTILGNLNIDNGTLVLQSTIDAPGTLTVKGNIIVGNAGTGRFNATNSNINLEGNWSLIAGQFEPGTGTVTFAGSAAQTVSGSAFNNLTFKNSSTAGVSVRGDLIVSGNVTLTQGTLHLGSHTMNRTSVDGSLTLAAGTTLEITGTDNFPANYSANNLDAASTVLYAGADAQQVKPLTYGTLAFMNGGAYAKSLTGNTTVKGDLAIYSGAKLDANNQTLTLHGNFSINGEFSPGVYTAPNPPTGTVILGATNGQKNIIATDFTVNNMIVSVGAMYVLSHPNYDANVKPEVSPKTNFTINGNIDITGNGDVYEFPDKPNPEERNFLYTSIPYNGFLNATNSQVEIAGNFRNSGMLLSNGLAKFLGERLQTIQLLSPIVPHAKTPPAVEFAGKVAPVFNSSRSPEFAHVTISLDNTEGQEIVTSVGWTVAGIFTVKENSTFNGGSYTHRFFSQVENKGTIKSAGLIDFSTPYPFMDEADLPPAHPFRFGNFESTGTVKFGGTTQIILAGNQAPKLNNVIISNKLGITTTTLDEEGVYFLGFTDWNLDGNLTIEAGGMLNTIPHVANTAFFGTNFNIKGELVNNGMIVSVNPKTKDQFGFGGNFTFTGANSKITGTGTTTLGSLTIAKDASLTIGKNIAVFGNLTHNGTDLQTGNSAIAFMGGVPSTISADPKVPLALSSIVVDKADPLLSVTLTTDLKDVVQVAVKAGILDLTTSNVAPKPDIVEEVTVIVDEEETTQTIITPVTTVVAAYPGTTIKVGGTSTLPAADVFSLALTSTVEYYGTNQQVKSVQYGNLTLNNIGAASFETGTALIAGNFTISGETGQTVATPETVVYNGPSNQIVAALPYQNLTLSNGGTKTFAAKHTVGLNRVLSISGVATKDAGVTVDASGTNVHVDYNGALPQAVLTGNYYNLTISGDGAKSFSGTTGIAKDFVSTVAQVNMEANSIIDINGSDVQSIAGLTYKNLRVSNSGDKNLTNNATIEESLYFDLTDVTTATATVSPLADEAARLVTGSNEVTLGPIATLSGESENSHVLGTIKTTRTVNAGSKAEFGGMGIAITPAEPAGNATLTRVTGTPIGKDNNSVARYFIFNPEQNRGKFNATIEATYLDVELNENLEDELILYSARFMGDGFTELNDPLTNPAVDNKITVTGINSINVLAFGSRNQPLPVELLSFTAVKKGNNAELKWVTASEENNQGFEVQVSSDGYNYQKLGFVESVAGTSTTKNTYNFTDARSNKNGIQYYRLKQLDYDGTYKFYGPKTVDFGLVVKAGPVELYPNPFKDKLSINITTPQAGKATFMLYTTTGKLLKTLTLEVQAGVNEHPLPLLQAAYEPGLYMLIMELNNQRQTLKLMKE